MIFYSGRGYLVIILFFVPLFVFGMPLNVFTAKSWWPLHSLMILGAILIIVVGRFANRKKVTADVIYEKSGPVIVLKTPHTLYWIPMEYWGPILLVIYFGLVALRYYNAPDIRKPRLRTDLQELHLMIKPTK